MKIASQSIELDFLLELTQKHPKLLLEITSRVKKLSLPSLDLKDLDGLELFWNLGSLDLSDNPNITNFDSIFKLKKLKHLNLSSVKSIDPEDIRYIMRLKELIMRDTNIKNIKDFLRVNCASNCLELLDIQDTQFANELKNSCHFRQKRIGNHMKHFVYTQKQATKVSYNHIPSQPITHYTNLGLNVINPVDIEYDSFNRKIKVAGLKVFIEALRKKGILQKQLRTWNRATKNWYVQDMQQPLLRLDEKVKPNKKVEPNKKIRLDKKKGSRI